MIRWLNVIWNYIKNKVSYCKKIARQSSRVDRVKIFLACSLITVQNLVVVSHTVRAQVGGPKFLATLGPRPL